MFESSIEFSSYNAESLREKGLVVVEDEVLGIAIVRYHKSDTPWQVRTHGACDLNDSSVRKHRSVVYSLTTGLPLYVAPIRRVQDGSISNRTLLDDEDNFIVTEYLDGTMINVFWNPHVDEVTGAPYGWTTTTRSKLNAKCRFADGRLYSELFDEARRNSGVDYARLDKTKGYTFMMLRPDIRWVIPYESPRVVLVSVSSCVPRLTAESGEAPASVVKMLSWDEMVVEGERIAENILPKRVDIPASAVLAHSMQDDVVNTLNGWMITHKSGAWDRVRIRTDGFERCSSLRGNTASRMTNYIRLMSLDPRGDAIRQYAGWYPKESDAIKKLSDMIQETITELIENYMSRHVKKTKVHDALPHWSRRPIWDLHGRYLQNRVPIKEPEVFAYFRDISPSVVSRMLKNREKENHRSSHTAAAATPAAEVALESS